MPTRNVNLTEHFDRFIENGIESGHCSNASEIVREGLRRLEQREQKDKAKLDWLRAAAKEGFDAADRGNYVALNSGEQLDACLALRCMLPGPPAAIDPPSCVGDPGSLRVKESVLVQPAARNG